jgi:hypothetical protein
MSTCICAASLQLNFLDNCNSRHAFCVLRNCVDYSNSNGLEPVSNLYSGLGRLMLQDELRLQLFWRFTYVFGRISDGTQIP